MDGSTLEVSCFTREWRRPMVCLKGGNLSQLLKVFKVAETRFYRKKSNGGSETIHLRVTVRITIEYFRILHW